MRSIVAPRFARRQALARLQMVERAQALPRIHAAPRSRAVARSLLAARHFAWSMVLPAVLLAALLAALLPALALADGFVVIRPAPGLPDPTQLAVRNHDVTIAIRDQVARVAIDQTFRNPNRREVEGEYLFPIPEGAAVSDFTLWVDGRPVHAEAMDAQAALRIYEDLVRESRDPALLEYAGREIFRARIFPFPARGDRRVALEYDQLVERQGGLYRFVYPLSTEKFSSEPLEHAFVSIVLEADRPVRNAYCPTHDVDIDYLDSRRVRLTFEERGTRPDRDLVFFYSLAEDAMDLRLVPYRPDSGADGYFMLLAAAGSDGNIPVLPKDVAFVIDQSGSMAGVKIEQARDALVYCLENLNPSDRFNVIAFSNGVEAFSEDLQSASGRRRDRAIDFVRDLESNGGTNIEEALKLALRSGFDRERPAFIVFLTDGLPTVGETDPQEILDGLEEPQRRPFLVDWFEWGRNDGERDRDEWDQDADERDRDREDRDREGDEWDRNRGDRDRDHGGGNRHAAHVRIFPFGVGYDVDSAFLDQLAVEHGGAPAYIRPTEDLEAVIGGFYDQIAHPVLTDVELRVNGVRFRNLEPTVMPDLFRGSQLVLFGRYRGSGAVELTLTGRSGGRSRTFTCATELPSRETHNDFIGRLWATRRVGSLLRRIRLYGEERELVEEVKDLGLRFGIGTPYTSFLVDEGEGPIVSDHRTRRTNDTWGGSRLIEKRGGSSHTLGAAPRRVLEGKAADLGTPLAPSEALRQSTGQAGFDMARKVEGLASARAESREDEDAEVRTAAGRSFRNDNGVWRQTDCPKDARTKRLEIGGTAYFDLLKAHPEIGAILALGERVVFKVGDEWYETVAK